MESIIAHASVLALMEAGGVDAPSEWRHDTRSGSLGYRYAGSPNTFTWDADGVAELAARAGDNQTSSAQARHLLERWATVERLVSADGQPTPDYFCVDHATDEFTLVWEDRKLVVIIGGDETR